MFTSIENTYRRYRRVEVIGLCQMVGVLIAKEEKKGDSVYAKDNAEEVETNGIYVDKISGDENEAYNAYNSYISKRLYP